MHCAHHQLKSVALSEAKRQQIMEAAIQEAQKEMAMANSFQARSVPHSEPFLVTKSGRPLTEPQPFALITEMRAEDRQTFDQHLKQKEQEMAVLKAEQEKKQAVSADMSLCVYMCGG